MLAHDLKEYIVNNDKTEYILKQLECIGVKLKGKEYRCGLPDDYNKNRIAVNKNTLSVKIFTKEETVRGDIFTLIMYIKQCSFSKSVMIAHDMLNMKYNINYKEIEKKVKNV